MKIRQIISNLGWDGVFWGLCGLVAFSLGILDFIPQLQLTQDPILRVTLSFIGLLLGAIVVQTAQRRAEIVELREELKDALGLTESRLLNTGKDFGQHLVPSILNARQYVWDTVLNRVQPSLSNVPYFSDQQGEYRRLLYERVSKGQLSFRRVEVIFHQKSLEYIIQRLLMHEGYEYYIRYYEAPPTAIPIVNLMSFDGDAFYLGGFHTSEAPGADPVLFIREPQLAKVYKNYWNALWNSAIPVNEGKVINWEELQRIGARLDMTEDEFESMVSRVKEEIKREKRRFRLS